MKKAMLALIASFLLSSCGFTVVDTGHVGIKTTFGEVVGTPLNEGFYLYNPFTSSIIELDYRTQRWESSTEAFTRDVQYSTITFVINYSPVKEQLHFLYQNIGRDYANVLLPQIVFAAIKDVTGQYEAVNLVENREKAATLIEKTIAESLQNDPKASFIKLSSFHLTDIKFKHEFEEAVEKKVVATQRAAEAKNKTVEIEEQAKQTVLAAQAEARSMQIRAEALAKNKSLVEYEAVQKWNGQLPQTIMGGAVPFLNVGNLK